MESAALQNIAQRSLASRQHNDRVRSLLPGGAAASLRVDFARCAIDLALEHHSALVRVVQAGEYGAAAALLRPLLEAATAGYWFIYSAPCSAIQRLPTTSTDNPQADIPGLADMLKSLIPVFPPIQRMSDGLKPGGAAKWLHKYTHGGTPQLTRRAPEGWTLGDALLTLIRADMFSTLAACLETVIAPNEQLASYGFGYRDQLAWELQTSFQTESISPQPHSLPAAPLLLDSCGPPFA